MINPLTVVWSDYTNTFEQQVDNVSEALVLAHHIAATSGATIPTVAEFFEPDSGLGLDIGLGLEETVVNFAYSLDPPYFTSLGDTKRQGIISFCCGNEETEFLARNAVPIEKGLAALAWFVEHRSKPNNLKWENP